MHKAKPHFKKPSAHQLHPEITRVPIQFHQKDIAIYCQMCGSFLLPLTFSQFYMKLHKEAAEVYGRHSLVMLTELTATNLEIEYRHATFAINPFLEMAVRIVNCRVCKAKVGHFFETTNALGTQWLLRRMALDISKVNVRQIYSDSLINFMPALLQQINKHNHLNSPPIAPLLPIQSVNRALMIDQAIKEEARALIKSVQVYPPGHPKREQVQRFLRKCQGFDQLFETAVHRIQSFERNCRQTNSNIMINNKNMINMQIRSRKADPNANFNDDKITEVSQPQSTCSMLNKSKISKISNKSPITDPLRPLTPSLQIQRSTQRLQKPK